MVLETVDAVITFAAMRGFCGSGYDASLAKTLLVKLTPDIYLFIFAKSLEFIFI